VSELTVKSVGVIGLGKMGRPIARHLVAAGYGVSGFDQDRDAASAAAASGIAISTTCADVARMSDLILVTVGFEEQVEEAVFSTDGILAGAGRTAIVAIASTVSPSYMIELARRVKQRGLDVIDIPLARGERAAEKGSLLILGGGPEDVLARCRPVLETFSDALFRLGDVGAGQVAKAVNNMLLWTCLCANVEGLDFAEAFGVDREILREALQQSSGANWALQTRADERPALWAEKDMMILLSEADEARVAMPVSGTVKEAIKAFKIARDLPMPKRGG
jgi:3-hydroxyisobutyrate dehydrogenase-like beta-hydroxyacid dehydrogenase